MSIIRFTVGVFVISFLIGSMSCDNTPRQQLVFFNTSDRELNVVLEQNTNYVFDKFINPDSKAFTSVPEGKYNILTFDNNGKQVRSIKGYDLKVSDLPISYLCIDLEGKTTYVMVRAAYLYEATNSLSEAIRKTSGVEDKDIIQGYYKSNEPFLLSFAPIWPHEPMPEETSTTSSVWSLVPISSDLQFKDKDDVYGHIDEYLRSLSTDPLSTE